jgi:hypothetical protein
MSILHRDEPSEAGVNDALAVETIGSADFFRANVRQNSYHSRSLVELNGR